MAKHSYLLDKTHMTQRAFMTWLTVFALFAQALMPLTQAWAFDAQTDGELQVICTASGILTIATGQNGDPIEPTDTVSCPFCVVHIASAVFSPEVSTVTESASFTGHDFAQPSTYTPSSIWRGTPRPSRAPPLSV